MTSPEPTLPTNMMMAALWWAAKNINVLPLHYPADGVCSCGNTSCTNPAKHPIARLVPHGLSDATTDPAVIKGWWTQEPYANIGVCTGETFDLLDIDSADGADTLRAIAEQVGGMPTNMGHARSGRDGAGIHIYVVPGGQRALSGGRTAPLGIDVKGRGGYAVVAPSLHISGRRYTWIDNRFDSGEIVGEIDWPEFYPHLVAKPKLQPPRAPRPTTVIAPDAASAYGRAVLARAVELVRAAQQGHRWQTLAIEAIPLVARGVDGGCIDRDGGVRELEEAARSVGLDQREVNRISGLVDEMIESGIRNPIRPKEAVAVAEPLTTHATEEEARSDPWDPPWPLRHPTPPFPVDCLGWMAPAVRELSDQLQVPVDLTAMMTIAAVSATIRGRIRAKVHDNWEEPLNLYVAAILGPGETKSPALARIVAPLREMESRARDRVKRTISERQFAKELAEKKAQHAKDKAMKTNGPEHEVMLARGEAWQAAEEAEAIVVPTMPLWLAGDMTPEALVSKLAEQGGALAHLSAEGELLDTIVGGRYSGGAPHLSALLTAHDGREPVRVHRKRDPDIEVPSPCLTLGLAVQPQVLEQLGKVDAAVRRGLGARFLFAVPASLVGHRDMTLRAGFGDIGPFSELLEGVDRICAGRASNHPQAVDNSVDNSTGHPQAEGFGYFGSDRFSFGSSVSAGQRVMGILGPSSRAKGVEGEENQGFGDIGYKSLKYGFLPSSLTLLFHYREALEPRRAATTGDLGDLGAWSNKLDGHLVRLSAILQLVRDADPSLGLDRGAQNTHNPLTSGNPGDKTQTGWTQNTQNPRPIEVEAVAAALVLGDYLIAHAIEAHVIMSGGGSSSENSRAEQLLGWACSQGAAEFTARDAERSLRKRTTFREQGSVQRACGTLERLGWIRRIPEEKRPGRPSARYLIHPEARR